MIEHDPHHIHVIGGQCVVSTSPDTILFTVLGSCVSACIYDPVAGIGGMNHFLLPTGGHRASPENRNRYGDAAMTNLVHSLIRFGAEPERLVAKLYGGRVRRDAKMDPGTMNAAFARQFLHDAGIKIADARLGDDLARWVTFQPATGLVKLREAVDPTVTTGLMAPLNRLSMSSYRLAS
ncbi:chemotaxis protein CheD [Rhizobium oryzicola]|uniref:Probable chemoreceptor glutamine deamidase CheD n=1 Tax=Rhizobium oryzicola TaxID=1232668 RepID=A0ABT8SUZ3_9HYPH|nr:chemotaxis protein CheD [Rhizobium oryzicola]MDO1582151.1 chemotaxis protein CheD [Rhizobium oryzicola]